MKWYTREPYWVSFNKLAVDLSISFTQSVYNLILWNKKLHPLKVIPLLSRLKLGCDPWLYGSINRLVEWLSTSFFRKSRQFFSTICLLSSNEQDTSHKLYMWQDSFAGRLILVSRIFLCLRLTMLRVLAITLRIAEATGVAFAKILGRRIFWIRWWETRKIEELLKIGYISVYDQEQNLWKRVATNSKFVLRNTSFWNKYEYFLV